MNLQNASLCLTIALLGTTLAGCGGRETRTARTASAAPALVHHGALLTEQECQEFGKRIEAAIASGDAAAVEDIFRLGDLCEVWVGDLNLSSSFRRGVLKGVKSAQRSQFSQQLIDVVKDGGKYAFVRARMEERPPSVVMRVELVSGGLNYYLLRAVRVADGRIAVQDMHNLMTGEPFSLTFRRLIIGAAAEMDGGVLQRLSGADKLYSENISKFQAMTLALQQDRHLDALNAYHQLPQALQNDKAINIMAIIAAQGVGNDEYLKMVSKFRQRHAGDPSLHLIMIDYFLLHKQYDKALECIENIDSAVGGDPYLLVVKANILNMAGRFAEAKTASEKAVELTPTLDDGYWTRITAALNMEEYPDALAWLQKIVTQRNRQIDVEQMKQTAEYAGFVKSPEYQQFVKWYAAQGR